MANKLLLWCTAQYIHRSTSIKLCRRFPINFIDAHKSYSTAENRHYNRYENSQTAGRRKSWVIGLTSIGIGLGLGLKYYCDDDFSEQVSNVFLPRVFAAKPAEPEVPSNKGKGSDGGLRNRFNFIAEVVEKCASPVVYIEIKDQRRVDFFTKVPATTSNGSGFIVREDGLILTNAHVVINKPHSTVHVRLTNGQTCLGVVEDVDVNSDLATVRINVKGLPVMKLGNSSDLRPGEFVIALGSPLALSNTVTAGVVSSVSRQSQELGLPSNRNIDYIQTDAAITFGNSGGPLVNLDGEVIGINSMKVAAGISFAIPIDYAKQFLAKAEENAKIRGQSPAAAKQRRYMGITMLTLTSDIIQQLQTRNHEVPVEVTHGVLVWKVVISSPAYNGGLKPADIITHLNGEPVTSASDIYKALDDSSSRSLNFIVVRGLRTINLTVKPETY